MLPPTAQVHNTAFTILGTLLSFLLVSRVNQGLARYTSGRSNLADIAFESREMAVKILGSGELSVTTIAGGHEKQPAWKMRAVRMVKGERLLRRTRASCCHAQHNLVRTNHATPLPLIAFLQRRRRPRDGERSRHEDVLLRAALCGDHQERSKEGPRRILKG